MRKPKIQDGVADIPMEKDESPKKKPRKKPWTGGLSKQEIAEARRLSKEILAEARKIAQMEVQRMAEEVLSEATVIARWQKKPFYVS